MQITNLFKGYTGKELLGLVDWNGEATLIGDEMTQLIPCTMPFANQAEISTIDEATHVSCQTRFMDRSILVRIK